MQHIFYHGVTLTIFGEILQCDWFGEIRQCDNMVTESAYLTCFTTHSVIAALLYYNAPHAWFALKLTSCLFTNL